MEFRECGRKGRIVIVVAVVAVVVAVVHIICICHTKQLIAAVAAIRNAVAVVFSAKMTSA